MASSTEVDVKELSKLVRSIIMSEKGGMEKDKFLSVYKSQEGAAFPFKVKLMGHSRTYHPVDVSFDFP